ncbi:MAG TPA: tetratricopeptide repeat protein [Steroidobacteraceae bacterium]|nr:tetratricopeptide repeat protein [Steroidobacteraceae bacterium]
MQSAHAEVTAEEAADYENRIEFGFLSQDAHSLKTLAKSLTTLSGEDDGDRLAHYLAAHADFRLAQVLNDTHKDGASDSAKDCVDQLAALTHRNSPDAEAYIQKAACHALVSATSMMKSVTHGPSASDAVATALTLAPKNPRARLVDALVDYWRPAKLGGDPARAFTKFKAAADAFDALPAGTGGFPEWGSADVYYWLGKSYAERGDVAAARNALEQALIVAPDFAAARRELSRLASRSGAN